MISWRIDDEAAYLNTRVLFMASDDTPVFLEVLSKKNVDVSEKELHEKLHQTIFD